MASSCPSPTNTLIKSWWIGLCLLMWGTARLYHPRSEDMSELLSPTTASKRVLKSLNVYLYALLTLKENNEMWQVHIKVSSRLNKIIKFFFFFFFFHSVRTWSINEQQCCHTSFYNDIWKRYLVLPESESTFYAVNIGRPLMLIFFSQGAMRGRAEVIDRTDLSITAKRPFIKGKHTPEHTLLSLIIPLMALWCRKRTKTTHKRNEHEVLTA